MIIYKEKIKGNFEHTALVDIDGVILNFQEGLRLVLKEKGITFNPAATRTYNYDGDVGCSKDEIFAEFRNPKLYKTAPFLERALDGLPFLNQFANTHAYTGSVDSPEVVTIREKLCNVLPFNEYSLFVGEHKGVKLPNKAKPNVVFDDCPAVINMWCSMDVPNVYVIDAPYNRGCVDERCIRMNDFYDAVVDYRDKIL